MIQGASIIGQAKAFVAISELVGREVKIVRAGNDFRSACPICGTGSKGSNPFWGSDQKGRWFCHAGCQRGGDVIDLERELRGGDVLEAAKRIVGELPSIPRQPINRPVTVTVEGPSASERVVNEIWAGAREISGTLVERYLVARGISKSVIDQAAPRLRFHPAAKWGWDEIARRWIVAPAMVVRVETIGGFTGGIHVTYLDRSGHTKADLKPAKRMWGRQADDAGRPGGAWLIGPRGPQDLVVAEGIETALSLATFAERAGYSVQCAAALSLRSLQGGFVLAEGGVFDPADVRPDPAKPAFTWSPPDGVRAWRVVIGVDRDMSPLRVKVRNIRGKVQDATLGGEARARLCARLAVQAWKAAGASAARAVAPGARCDFNDQLQYSGRSN